MSKEKGKNEYGAFWARFMDKSKDTSKGKLPVATLRRNSSSSFDIDSIKTESSVAPQKRPKRKRAVIKNDEFDQLPMCGVTVRLPVGLKPYPSQKLIMVRILTAIKNNMNVLAESPTGSGKTMALLASTCAWLRMYQDDRKLAKSKCEIHGDEAQIVKNEPLAVHKNDPEETSDAQIKKENTVENQWIEDFIPHDGQENVKKEEPIDGTIKTEEPVCTCLPRVRIYYGTRTHKQIAQVVKEFGRLPYAGIIKHTILASREQSCINPAARKSPDISQFCKEVNGTDGIGCSFKTAMRNRYEKAATLRSHLEYNGTVVFDTDGIVETLAQSTPQLCPYFCTTRVLTQDADLIFCPFSYLVDPIIRNSSDVHVKNAIVVLDEAHNIEDTCRDAASFVFSEKELDDALLSFRIKKNAIDQEIESGLSHNGADTFEERVNDKMATLKEMRSNLMLLEHLMLEILRWVRKLATGAKEKGRDGTKSSTLTSSSLFGSLTDVESGIDLYTPQNTPRYTAISGAFNALAARNEAEMQYFDAYKPSATAIVCIEKWLYFQSYFGQPDYQKTYRCNLTIEPIQQKTSYFKGRNAVDLNSTMEYRQKGAGPRNMKYADDDFSNDSYDVHNSTWLNTSGAAPSSDSDTKWIDTDKPPSGHQPIAPGCKTTVSLWCMSPALSFVDAFSQSRSVILASGTLCPMDTLKTELGMEFKQQMEGSQVISKDRIFAAVLPVGPGGNRIQCTYRHTSDEKSPFYSELGAIIQYVCSNISAGILCFLPSYRVLDQLKDHLEKSSKMKSIEMKKVVLCEPRRSSELAQVMLEYDKAIAEPKYFGPTINGALMFAVFRGKVSEGIDFADDRARVVISVGIPFPSSTDELVTAKRIYNDENSKTLGILNGEEWYVTQAYRALNQALGRCLRHKNDWGAMLMIDERLERQSRNITTGAASARVSKWIREQLKSYPNFQDFNDEFREFYIRMRNEDIECGDVKKEIKTEDG